ncbi:MAG TPA: AHH domain-containing protein [Anaeromyxobacter sp.]
MADKVSEHFAEYRDAKHKKSSSAEGENGACIAGPYEAAYRKNNSCSYRWQTVMAYSVDEGAGNKDGRENPFKTPRLKAAIETSRYETAKSTKKRRRYYPAGYPAKLPVPRKLPEGKNDWGITGPDSTWVVKDPETDKRLFTIPAKQNFKGKKCSMWPWWNNAHHIIPKATLKKAIAGVENPKDWKSRLAVKTIITRFLLKKLYNVNHHRNVIILPMDKEVGAKLGLPRHLVLGDKTAIVESGDTSPKFDHQRYNKTANSRLDEIMRKFSSAAKKAAGGKACVTEEMEAAKEMLDTLSDDLHSAILLKGAGKQGDPISLITETDLAKASST